MDMNVLLSPPAAFLILLFAAGLLSVFFNGWSSPKRQKQSEGKKAYACGEDFKEHMIQPDYSEFFPFAFFFTILHVVALMVATVPTETFTTFAIAVLYIAGAIIGLCVLLRKQA